MLLTANELLHRDIFVLMFYWLFHSFLFILIVIEIFGEFYAFVVKEIIKTLPDDHDQNYTSNVVLLC